MSIPVRVDRSFEGMVLLERDWVRVQPSPSRPWLNVGTNGVQSIKQDDLQMPHYIRY